MTIHAVAALPFMQLQYDHACNIILKYARITCHLGTAKLYVRHFSANNNAIAAMMLIMREQFFLRL